MIKDTRHPNQQLKKIEFNYAITESLDVAEKIAQTLTQRGFDLNAVQ